MLTAAGTDSLPNGPIVVTEYSWVTPRARPASVNEVAGAVTKPTSEPPRTTRSAMAPSMAGQEISTEDSSSSVADGAGAAGGGRSGRQGAGRGGRRGGSTSRPR